MVGEDLSEQMVEFMLDNTGCEAAEFLLVRLEILIEPTQTHMLVALHILADSRQGL